MSHAAETATGHPTRCGCGGPHNAKQGGSAPELRAQDQARPAASALDILDERFARGEIEKAEYLEKKELISQRPTSAHAG